MCFEDENVDVPQSEVKTMLQSGATCGCCGSAPGCCPTTPVVDGKIDMCTRTGRDINVSVNACKGILRSGGTCGPCEVIEEVVEAKAKTTKTTKATTTAKAKD